MYRVTIGTPSKFGGDGYEFHTWCPPHVGPDDLEEFLRIHDKDPEVTRSLLELAWRNVAAETSTKSVGR